MLHPDVYDMQSVLLAVYKWQFRVSNIYQKEIYEKSTKQTVYHFDISILIITILASQIFFYMILNENRIAEFVYLLLRKTEIFYV